MPAVREDDTLDGFPAVSAGETVENVLQEPEPDSPEAQAAVRRESSPSARARLVLTMLALLAVAAVLLVWGLVR